jgi:hypothetical protein
MSSSCALAPSERLIEQTCQSRLALHEPFVERTIILVATLPIANGFFGTQLATFFAGLRYKCAHSVARQLRRSGRSVEMFPSASRTVGRMTGSAELGMESRRRRTLRWQASRKGCANESNPKPSNVSLIAQFCVVGMLQ